MKALPTTTTTTTVFVAIGGDDRYESRVCTRLLARLTAAAEEVAARKAAVAGKGAGLPANKGQYVEGAQRKLRTLGAEVADDLGVRGDEVAEVYLGDLVPIPFVSIKAGVASLVTVDKPARSAKAGDRRR